MSPLVQSPPGKEREFAEATRLLAGSTRFSRFDRTHDPFDAAGQMFARGVREGASPLTLHLRH